MRRRASTCDRWLGEGERGNGSFDLPPIQRTRHTMIARSPSWFCPAQLGRGLQRMASPQRRSGVIARANGWMQTLAGIAPPLFRDGRRAGAARMWGVLGARRRAVTGAGAASWSRATAGSGRTTGSSARMRRDAGGGDLRTQVGCNRRRPARRGHGPGMTASPAATASGGSRRRPVWRCGPGGVTARPVLSGAVLARCARYGGLALSGADLDALGVHFLRLGYQDQQDAVLG